MTGRLPAGDAGAAEGGPGHRESVVLTTREGCGDVVVRGGVNQAVKRLERLYEPYLWERK